MRAATVDAPEGDATGAPTPAAAPRAPARWLSPALLLVLSLLPCLALLCAERALLDGRLGLPLDDGFIHLQFARSLAHGDGLAYNPGQRVPGSTAPLWTALLALGFLLRLPPLAWAQALGIAAQVATVFGTRRLARAQGLPRGLALLAAALAATSGALVWGALSGMEVTLFAALATWGMAQHAAERERGGLAGAALLALAALVRPEGLLLVALALADRWLHARRDDDGALSLRVTDARALAGALLLALVALLPLALAYRALGGSVLPTTFDTKAGYSAPGLPRAQYLYDVVGVVAATLPLATLLAPAGALVLLARLGTRRDRGLLPALWTAALPLAYGVLSGQGRGIFGNFGRYFYPLVPAVAVLAALALVPLRAALPARLRLGPLALHWPLWAGVLLVAANLAALAPAGARYLHNVRDVEQGDVRLARLLAPRLPPQATLGVDDIGALKFLLPNRVVDLAGIVTPQLHAYARESFARTGSYCPGLLAFVRVARPDYLALFPRRHACFDPAEFPLLLRLEIPDNITLGEDTIELRAAPWTRFPLLPPPAAPAPAASQSAP